jgi:[acyl-carrier-protein] S-malonyltransferase
MGRALYDGSPSARKVFAQADSVLGVALSELCFEGPAAALNDTFNTQPAILATSIAGLRALEERGTSVPSPDFVAGHSLGEFSALVAARALTLEDGLRLVRERGRVMRQAGACHPGGMVAVLGLEREAVKAICDRARRLAGEYVGLANDNCPGQVVISGASKALETAMNLAKEAGAKRALRLAVSIPAHSPLMADAATKFRETLEATAIRPAAVPFVANATAEPVGEPDAIREALGQQLTSPILWTDSVRWLIASGVERVIEIGPKAVLVGLVRRIDSRIERVSVSEMLPY